MKSVDGIKLSTISIYRKFTNMGSVDDGLVKQVKNVENNQQLISTGFHQNKCDLAVIADDTYITSLLIVDKSMADQNENLLEEQFHVVFFLSSREGQRLYWFKIKLKYHLLYLKNGKKIISMSNRNIYYFLCIKKAKEAGKRVSFNNDKLFTEGEQSG